jgi:tRNA nucleotidyltransferase (CCA-adding enzyme)
VLEPFGKVEPIGKSFPVYKVGNDRRRASSPRIQERPRHKGFRRRRRPVDDDRRGCSTAEDFTVNAISWDPLTDEYFDPFEGRADLETRILKAVDPDTFGDDSLRGAARGSVRRALRDDARR